MTGSAFLPWGEIEPEKLRVTKGADTLISIGDPSATTRSAVESASRCCIGRARRKIRVPYGSLIDEPTLKPTAHMFVGSKAAWHEILDDLPQHDESPWS